MVWKVSQSKQCSKGLAGCGPLFVERTECNAWQIMSQFSIIVFKF